MRTIALLTTAALFVAVSPAALHSAEKAPVSRSDHQAQVVLAKQFLVAMRRNDHAALRKAIHPFYLAKHGLVDKEQLPMEIAPVLGIHNLVPTLDGTGMLCLYKSKTGQKESLLLRIKMKGDVPYIHPATEPDPKSGKITPWLLRQNLEKFIQSK